MDVGEREQIDIERKRETDIENESNVMRAG